MNPYAHQYAILFFPPALPSPSSNAQVNFATNSAGILNGVYGNILGYLLLIAGIVAVIYVVWSGIQYITAAGNPDKVKKARASFITAFVGVIIVAATYFILRFAVGIGNTISGL